MKISIESLSREEASTLARIRLSVTVHLVAEAAAMDKGLAELCEASFSLSLAVPGIGEKAWLICAGGRVAAGFGRRPSEGGWTAPCGMLVFPDARSCSRALAGGRGMILPLPFGPGFFRALRFFKAAAGRAPELLRSADTTPQAKARLLLAATAHGLAAVAGDPYLEKRMRHFPDGIVRIEAGSAIFRLEKKGRTIAVLAEGSSGKAPSATRPSGKAPSDDAVLAFSSPEAAVAVLSGKRQAVVALGAGEVAVAGLLPLVQGLFAVLDRLSWYLAIPVRKEEK